MILAVDSALDLVLSYLVVCAVIAASVSVALRRAPERPPRRSVIGGALLAVAAFVLITSVGGALEMRLRGGPGYGSALGSEWPACIASALFAAGGAWALRHRGASVAGAPRPIQRRDVVRIGAVVLIVAAAAVFAFPVWDVHFNGWSDGYHGHTYAERGFHFH